MHKVNNIHNITCYDSLNAFDFALYNIQDRTDIINSFKDCEYTQYKGLTMIFVAPNEYKQACKTIKNMYIEYDLTKEV